MAGILLIGLLVLAAAVEERRVHVSKAFDTLPNAFCIKDGDFLPITPLDLIYKRAGNERRGISLFDAFAKNISN